MKNVLVIDDSRVVLDVTRIALEGNGYRVNTLLEPGEFDPKAQGVPDLVLVDVNMPQFFGDDVVDYIRSAWELDSPILLFSNIAEEELRDRAKRCGADGYISKQWGLSR